MRLRHYLELILAAVLACNAPAWDSDNSSREKKTPTKIHERLMGDSYSRERPKKAVVDTLVLHFSSDVLAHPDAPFDVDRMIEIYKEYNVSIHYLIDRKGSVYRLVKERRSAFHAGKGDLQWAPERKNKLNDYSIGIELLAIGSINDMKIFMSEKSYARLKKDHPEYIGFTDEQYRSLTILVEDIRSRWPAVAMDRKHILGHEDYAPDRRSDPGELFDWKKLGLKRAVESGDDEADKPGASNPPKAPGEKR